MARRCRLQLAQQLSKAKFCKEEGCKKRLGRANKIGYCPKHRKLHFGEQDRIAAARRTLERMKTLRAKAAEADRLTALQVAKQHIGRGRQRDKDTDRRIELAAKLSLQGLSLKKMSTEVYPEKKYTPDNAYERMRKLVSDYRPEFNAAKQRPQSSVK